MGGGTSRLDETDWETADGGITTIHQTIDGELPTSKYQLYEIRKQSVGQRAFDVVDSEQNVVLTTQGVPGTLSWFDVLGPKSIGEFKDWKLRVQADMSRRTWIVYRYHTPVFPGQKAANETNFPNDDSNNDEVAVENNLLFKGIEPGVKLYKTACITVSWSRYVAVAARYGPPNVEDFLTLELQEEDDYDDDNRIVDTATNGSPVKIQHDDNVTSPPHIQSPSKVSEDDPLFSVARQIAVRSRERANTSPSTPSEIDKSNEVENEQEQNMNHQMTDESHANTDEDDQMASEDVSKVSEGNPTSSGIHQPVNSSDQDTLPIDERERESKAKQSSNSKESTLEVNTVFDTAFSSDTVSPSTLLPKPKSNSTTATSPPKRSSGPKLPALTLTELAASHNSSTSSRRTSVRTQKIRDYFGISNTTASTSGGQSSRFGSRFFQMNTGSNLSDQGGTGDDASAAAESQTNNTPTPRQLYERALEGVIDLDAQPIVQCQEISCKILGNHQTFNMTKEQLFQLLRLDEKQHEAQLQQETEGGNDNNSQQVQLQQESEDDSVNPMVQAMELDAVHHEHQQQGGSEGRSRRSSRWISSLRSLRTRTTNKERTNENDSDDAATTSETLDNNSKNDWDAVKESASSSSLHGSSPSHSERLRSSFHRIFSSKSTEESQVGTTEDMVRSVEKSLSFGANKNNPNTEGLSNQDVPTTLEVANGLDRDNMPNLLDDSNSSSQPMDDASDSGENARKIPASPSPGDGVEESKVEAAETPQKSELNPTSVGETEQNVLSEGEVKVGQSPITAIPQPADKHPHPLVGYWFWKHTTFHFGQHKMYMHLAKNSDLALHLVLSIIVNQVRSERNHTIFATTGLHPALFFIDPKNPKAMIS